VAVVVTCTMFTSPLPVLLAQVSRAMGLLTEESKEHELIMEREGKYLPVVDEPRRLTSKSRLPSYGQCHLIIIIYCHYFFIILFIIYFCHIIYLVLNAFFGFSSVQWLPLTSDVDRSVRFSCQKYKKVDCFFWDAIYMAYCCQVHICLCVC